MIEVPEIDAAPDAPCRETIRLRYEDVAQDGRIKLDMLPTALGVVWREQLAKHPDAGRMFEAGIVPIMRRMVIVGSDTPLSVHRSLETDGVFGMAHARTSAADEEARTRFLLNIRVNLRGPRGATNGPPPARAGEIEAVGAVYAEHVLTRLFAPPDQRRVDALPEGVSPGPPCMWIKDEVILETDAEVVDAAFTEVKTVRFALRDTDGNHHVNSLVYPRLFEEAATSAWDDGARLMRSIEIACRKPSFVNERVTVQTRRIQRGDERGVLARLLGDDERPRCVARLWLG